MKDYGFIRVAAAVPEVRVASVSHNVAQICRLIKEAAGKEAAIVVFPELSVTGATCADLFKNRQLAKSAEDGIAAIADCTKEEDITVVAGAPVAVCGKLYNCAVIIKDGRIGGIVPQTCISADSRRWFASGTDLTDYDVITYAGQECEISPDLHFKVGKGIFAIQVGEEITAPESFLCTGSNAHMVLHPSADTETLGSHKAVRDNLAQHSRLNCAAYVHASAGTGESTQDHVYAGYASIWENGKPISENERFLQSSLTVADIDLEDIENMRLGSVSSCLAPTYCIDLGYTAETNFEKKFYRKVEPSPFLPKEDSEAGCRDALAIQVEGLAKRISHINCRNIIMGISGGLDSTLALLVAALAFDRTGRSRKGIIGVTMPGFGTTSRTKNNAWDLMKALGVTGMEIPIGPAVEQHFKDISHDPSVHDATYENSQARERTQILMDLANKEGGIVIGTGDMSELALGWATYNGDHMSMYGVNAGVPKTMVRSIVAWAAANNFENESAQGRTVREILMDILGTPISPELLPAAADGTIAQVTEDLVGPYELHDFFLYNMVNKGHAPDKIYFLARKAFGGEYEDAVILKWLKTFIRRFFSQQFKRSCMPDGPQVCSVSLSPRGGWMMPSDAWSTDYLAEL